MLFFPKIKIKAHNLIRILNLFAGFLQGACSKKSNLSELASGHPLNECFHKN